MAYKNIGGVTTIKGGVDFQKENANFATHGIGFWAFRNEIRLYMSVINKLYNKALISISWNCDGHNGLFNIIEFI